MKRRHYRSLKKTVLDGRGWKQTGLRAPFAGGATDERLAVERMLNEGCPNVQPNPRAAGAAGANARCASGLLRNPT